MIRVERILEKKLNIAELLKILKQGHFKLVGIKLERVKTILESYIADGYTISAFNAYRSANLVNRCQDDRHVKFIIEKDNVEQNIEISIEKV